jgi:hypothetical protein
MAFIAGSFFFYRGVFECFTELSAKKNLDIYNVAPIITSVIPDVVPIICIVEVLLPFGLLTYVRSCVRFVKSMFRSFCSPSPRTAEQARLIETPAAHYRVTGVQQARSGQTTSSKEGVGGVSAQYQCSGIQ